ncbi:MAG: tRNA 2-selenouridine(34) synthase MnmH [Bacteroidetes bacterium]|nr:tRNA 2-selenouridine(34) synthase MnmH [Bacteroidota bacterium]
MEVLKLQVQQFLKEADSELLIDVRSPVEFNKGHIPGAINIPLFEDGERSEIGTIYKQIGRQTAIERGFEIVSPKLSEFIKTVKQKAQNKTVFVYCFRGGMRSNSFAWLLNTNGYETKILEGGYKSYRQHVLSIFSKKYSILLLGGKTGSGKTTVINYLVSKKNNVIDLEGLANHKGSAFGAINQNKQLPQQLFENYLSVCLSKCDSNSLLMLEDESMAIGYNKIPYPFWLQMNSAPLVIVEVDTQERLKQLLKDYTTEDVNALKDAVLKISERLGGDQTKICIEFLNQNNLYAAAQILLTYYDKAYTFLYSKKNNRILKTVSAQTINELCQKVEIELQQISNGRN